MTQNSPVITVANHKGGCGKTTTVVNLACEFANLGLNALVIDLDPQANASQHLSKIHPKDIPVSIKDVLMNADDIELLKQAICTTTVCDGVHLISSNLNLMLIEDALLKSEIRPFEVLTKIIKPLKLAYDVIIIDTPPDLRLFNKNALMCSTHYLVPIIAESVYDLYGSAQLQQFVNKLKRNNPQLEFLGVLLTRYDRQTTISKIISDEIYTIFGKILPIHIPATTAISKSSYEKEPLSIMKHYVGHTAYQELAVYLAQELKLVKEIQ